MSSDDRKMYRWRRMSAEQREAVLKERQVQGVPWHGPPHFQGEGKLFLLTASCFEHLPIVGENSQRMATFEQDLLDTCQMCCQAVIAWTLLPNHYHVLVHSQNVLICLDKLGRLNGRTSFLWNGEDHRRGRQVWHGIAETEMKSERHFRASILYVLNNAVRHGYVERWQD